MHEVFESERLMFRDITVSDTDMVLKWRNSEHVVNNFIYRSEVTREDHMNWLQNKIETGLVRQFIIIEKSSATPFGSIYFRDIDEKNKSAEYGIFLGEKSMMGKGYGSETARWAVDFFFNEMKFEKLLLRVLGRNAVAIKSYEQAGFVLDDSKTTTIEIDGQSEELLFMFCYPGDGSRGKK